MESNQQSPDRVLSRIVSAWSNLQRTLEAIDQLEIVREYPLQRTAKRQEALAKWRGEMIALLADIRRNILPQIRQKRQSDIAVTQEMVRSGRMGAVKHSDPFEGVLPHNEQLYRAGRAHAQLLAALDGVNRQLAVITALELWRLRPTEQISAKIGEYLEKAGGQHGEFPWAEWAIDRAVLGPLLAARAAQDDSRAEMAGRDMGTVEERLIAQTHPGSEALLSQLDSVVAELTAAVEGMLRDGREAIEAVAEILDPLERQAMRRAGQDPLAELERRRLAFEDRAAQSRP